MNNLKMYRFEGNLKINANMFLTVLAEDENEALDLINESIREDYAPLNSQIYLGSRISQASITFDRGFSVSEDMLVDDISIRDSHLTETKTLLQAKGYHYSGVDEEDAVFDDRPTFTKNIWNDDCSEICGYFMVERYFDRHVDRYGFKINLFYNPFVRSTGNTDSSAPYVIEVKSKQKFIGLDDLSFAVDVYEEKFVELIKALRVADPLDADYIDF